MLGLTPTFQQQQAHTFSGTMCTGWLLRLAALYLLLTGLVGCGSTQDLPEYESRTPQAAASSAAAENPRRRPARPTTVGKISLVNRDEKFVLIELESNRIPPTGTVLQAYNGQMRSANLKVAKEKKAPFLIADIVDGLPVQNDSVLLVTASTPAATASKRGSSGGGGPSDDMGYAGPAPELELLPADDEAGPDQSQYIDDVDLPDGPAPMLDPLPPLLPQQ